MCKGRKEYVRATVYYRARTAAGGNGMIFVGSGFVPAERRGGGGVLLPISSLRSSACYGVCRVTKASVCQRTNAYDAKLAGERFGRVPISRS